MAKAKKLEKPTTVKGPINKLQVKKPMKAKLKNKKPKINAQNIQVQSNVQQLKTSKKIKSKAENAAINNKKLENKKQNKLKIKARNKKAEAIKKVENERKTEAIAGEVKKNKKNKSKAGNIEDAVQAEMNKPDAVQQGVKRPKKNKQKSGKKMKLTDTSIESIGSDADDTITKRTDKSDLPSNKRLVLYVCNVDYKTTKEQIYEYFKSHCVIKNINIPLSKDTKKPRGFAYLKVADEQSYQNAMALNNTEFNNRLIRIKSYTVAGPTAPKEIALAAPTSENDLKSKKLMLFIGNIDFQTTKEDINEFFKKSCIIKDIDIPVDKETKKPRGFAYVEFANEESYKSALALNNTYMKNRRLRILAYTEKTSKKSKNKNKNKKLDDMRDKGMLIGKKKTLNKQKSRKAKPKN